MSKMQAFRVREVLTGHSSTAAVLAEDAQGRQLRLEVGALEGASIQAGELLVLSWATVQVPAEGGQARPTATTGVSAGDGDGDEAVMGRSEEDLEVAADEPRIMEEPSVLADFKALIGLR